MALDSAQAVGLNRSAVWNVRVGGMEEAKGEMVAGLVPKDRFGELMNMCALKFFSLFVLVCVCVCAHECV